MSNQVGDQRRAIVLGSPNPVNPLNVDDNLPGSVDPIDALQVINVLNAPGTLLAVNGLLPALRPVDTPFGFLDVDGDQFCAPVDALILINFLNAQSGGEGEFAGDGLGDGSQSSDWPAADAPTAAPHAPPFVRQFESPLGTPHGVSVAEPSVAPVRRPADAVTRRSQIRAAAGWAADSSRFLWEWEDLLTELARSRSS